MSDTTVLDKLQHFEIQPVEAHDDRGLEGEVRKAREAAVRELLDSPVTEAFVTEQAAYFRYLLQAHVQGLTEERLRAVPFPDRLLEGRLGNWHEDEVGSRAEERLAVILSGQEDYITGKQVTAPLSGGKA